MGRTRELAIEAGNEGAIRLHEPNRQPDHHIIEWDYGRLTIVERIWSDAQWDRLPEPDRPDRAKKIEGVGWSLVTVREDHEES